MSIPNVPWIKSSGGKRILKSSIHELFPDTFYTYWDPFLGSGVSLPKVCNKCSRMIASDINSALIESWNTLKFSPRKLINEDNYDLIISWYNFLKDYDISIYCRDYKWILDVVSENDFVFLDPPYSNSTNECEQSLNKEEFEDFLSKLKCKWFLTSDDEGIYEIDHRLYKKRWSLDSYKLSVCFSNY